MVGSFLGHAQTMFRVCLEHVCLVSVWSVFGSCLGHVSTSLTLVWDMFGTGLGKVWDMFGTFLGHVWLGLPVVAVVMLYLVCQVVAVRSTVFRLVEG